MKAIICNLLLFLLSEMPTTQLLFYIIFYGRIYCGFMKYIYSSDYCREDLCTFCVYTLKVNSKNCYFQKF